MALPGGAADLSPRSTVNAGVVRRLAGWGGATVEACRVFRPERRAAVGETLRRADESSYVARGLGRSYGDAALNAGAGVVSTLRLDRLLGFDPATGWLDVESGVSFADLVDVFLPRGFFPPVTPGTRHVTVGGAVAADVHGKNHPAAGSLERWVESVDVALPDGDVVRCSRTERPDLFRATLGGMGLTGVIVAVRLRLAAVPSAGMRTRRRAFADLGSLMSAFRDDAEVFPYAMAWVDALAAGRALGRGVLTQGRHAPAFPSGGDARRPVTVPFRFPGWTLNPLTVGAFNALYLARQRMTEETTVSAGRFFYPLDAVGRWNRLYGRRGFVQYQFAVPDDGAEATCREVLERLRHGGQAAYLGVLKRLGPAGEGLLSFPLPGWTLALDLPVRPGLHAAVRELDRVVVAAGGRVYLAKDALLDADTFTAMYPGAAEFLRVRREVDPHGRLCSSLARRVGLA